MTSALYCGLGGLLLLLLSLRVSQTRRRLGISTGDGGQRALFKAIRVHDNAVENIPVALILLVLLDLQGAEAALLHVLGTALLIGRCLHAWGLGSQPQVPRARQLGAGLTLAMIGFAAAMNILWSLT